ncbi:MAG: hypothetical protein M3Q71_02920 [Chloroflexota bacterium]|nr:hypothetical protein [Chloroflexota bacterium]
MPSRTDAQHVNLRLRVRHLLLSDRRNPGSVYLRLLLPVGHDGVQRRVCVDHVLRGADLRHGYLLVLLHVD